MYLHIGGSRVLRESDLLGIFDVRISDKQCNREFLQSAATVKDKNAENGEKYRSFVVSSSRVLFSPIAPGTLKKRLLSNVFNKK